MKDLAPGESAGFVVPLPLDKDSTVVATANCSKCGREIRFVFPIDHKNPNRPQRCKTVCECGQEYEFGLHGRVEPERDNLVRALVQTAYDEPSTKEPVIKALRKAGDAHKWIGKLRKLLS